MHLLQSHLKDLNQLCMVQFPISCCCRENGKVRESLVGRWLQIPESSGGGPDHGGSSRGKRKQMYSGYILETEVDLADALNQGGGGGEVVKDEAVRKDKDAFPGF